MKLYEFAVLFNPRQTQEQKDKGESAKAKLIVDVTRILANNDQEAMMHAARAIPQEYVDKLDRVDIAIRPF